VGNWQALEVTPPPGVTQLGQLLSTGLNTFTTALQSLKVTLQTTQAQAVDPASTQQQAINQAIQAAVQEIKTLIDQLVLSTGCYVLVIPVPKKSLVDPRTVTDEQDRNLVNPTYFPVGPFLQQLPAAQRARLYDRIDFAHLFDPRAGNVGGNAYLIKTLAESLYDAGDLQRPRWRGSMYWATCELIVGSPDYTQIANMLLFIDNLFSGATARSQNTSRSQTTLVPTSMSATVAYPESSANPAVILTWPSLPVGRILSAFESATLTPVRMAVIRSEDFRARNALRVSDLFSGNLTQGTTGQYGAQVIFEGDFDGITNRFVDTGPFEDGHDYYYHVAFQTRLSVPGSQPVLNDYAALSPAVSLHYTVRQQAPLTPSVPPDWMRTPSIVELIPPLADFLTRVKVYLDSFAAGSQTFTNHQQAYVEFIDKQIAKYTQQAQTIANNVERLIQIFSAPTGGGAYVRFGNGQGPVGDFIADFVEAITNQQDENRPPFDDGTEFTAGIVFLAASPDPAQAALSLGFLQALLSSAAELTPAQTAIAQINQTVAQAEQAALDALLGPTVTPSTTFALDGTPLPPGTPDPNCAT
jgi:hypothetical protein